jgi:glycosyltransferase involved in cell wall biosynthesis
VLRARLSLPPIVVDLDDLEHVKLERLAASTRGYWRRLGILAETSLALHALRRISTKATCLLVASELDRSKLQAACRKAAAAVIPNTAFTFGPLLKARSPVALFVGNAVYPPNREAIVWLMRDIWPLVREDVPEARLLIVGEGTQQLAAEYSGQGVEGLGFVSELASVYERAAIAVCPVRRGGGTRIKIIEAAMNARPVVSTVVGAEGLSLVPDTEILLDDSPAGFARACARLLLDPELAATIGEAARRRAEAHYAPAIVAERLTALCVGLLDRSNATGRERAEKFQGRAAPSEIGQSPSGRQAQR